MGVLEPQIARSHHGDPDWVFVDCRFDLADPEAGRKAWASETIAGAQFADLDRALSGPVLPGSTGRHPLPAPSELANTIAAWGVGAATHVVAFDDRGGPFAARLWWMLRWLGHDADHAHVLDGGLPAWTGPRAPGTIARPPKGTFAAEPSASMHVDAAQVVGRGDTVALLDARSPARFRGDEEPIDAEAGHIPGARSVPWVDSLVDGRFAPVEVLRERFAGLLGEEASSAILYCGSGVTACHDLLAIEHAGLGLARLYPGSWSEWITDATRPRAKGD